MKTSNTSLSLVDFSKTAVIDTNLLLLLISGLTDPSQIGVASRLKQYTYAHFEVLSQLCFKFKYRTVTPHILTETSNIGRSIFRGNKQYEFSEHLVKVVGAPNNNWTEQHIPMRDTKTATHGHFGLTDAALLCLPKDHLVISDDGKLTSFLHHNVLPSLCFLDLWEQLA